MPALSVTIITFNEIDRLEEAIRSVAWADEILVLDSGSTDGTVDLARRLATRVEVTDWPGYAAQKNRAAALARHDWILSIDADERVGPRLATAFETWKKGDAAASGYRVARVSKYLGRWIRTTDWYPDWQLRLYDRRRARWTERRVHESVEADGPVDRLTGELQHLPYRNVSDHLQRIDRYTTLAAADMKARGKRASYAALAVQPGAAFLRNFVLRRGILDGRVGLAVSLLNSYYVLLKYVKLLQLETRAERD